MKTFVLFSLATVAFFSISACTTVEDRDEPSVRSSTTTTTQERSIQRPSSSTTETQTIRSY